MCCARGRLQLHHPRQAGAGIWGAGPTEPSFPKAKPPIPSRAPARPAPPSAAPPVGAIPLPPDQNVYVSIETKSGSTPSWSRSTTNCCMPCSSPNSPVQDGERANGVNITASGSVQWVLGNLGDIPTVTIDYRTYDAEGWTIAASESGTRFTNKSSTGHGMFVSVEHVDTFSQRQLHHPVGQGSGARPDTLRLVEPG